MPAGKKLQVVTLIIFVVLFIVALAGAIIFFIQSEGHKAKLDTLQSQTEDLATDAELRKIGQLVGEKQRQKSRVGTMLSLIDETTNLITGAPSEETAADSKVSGAKQKVKDAMELLVKAQPDMGLNDSNTAGLVPIIERLNVKLINSEKAAAAVQQQLTDLQNRFDDAMKNNAEKEKTLSAEKEKYQQLVNKIQKDYDGLRAVMEKSSSQQIKSLMNQLDEEKATTRKLNQELLKTQAELKMAQEKTERIQESLQAIVPPPDSEVAAYKVDARVILIDENAKTVLLNVGSNDHVYQGLTFSIYDKNMPVPKDGKGKAEVEVFSVGKDISTARIAKSEPRKPIIVDDIAANLVWDSSRTNVFVVAGDFDLNGDGTIDYNGAEKIKALIEKWGGRVEDNISSGTDFLILGIAPQMPRKPTFEETEADPMAIQKYEKALKQAAHYEEVQKQAQALSVPVFNTERFLYFTGYKSQADRPGAF